MMPSREGNSRRLYRSLPGRLACCGTRTPRPLLSHQSRSAKEPVGGFGWRCIQIRSGIRSMRGQIANGACSKRMTCTPGPISSRLGHGIRESVDVCPSASRPPPLSCDIALTFCASSRIFAFRRPKLKTVRSSTYEIKQDHPIPSISRGKISFLTLSVRHDIRPVG